MARERKHYLEEYINVVAENDIYLKMLKERYENDPGWDLPACDRSFSGFRGELFNPKDNQPQGKLRKLISFVIESRILRK